MGWKNKWPWRHNNPIKVLGQAMWIITSKGDHTRQFQGKTLYIPKENAERN